MSIAISEKEPAATSDESYGMKSITAMVLSIAVLVEAPTTSSVEKIKFRSNQCLVIKQPLPSYGVMLVAIKLTGPTWMAPFCKAPALSSRYPLLLLDLDFSFASPTSMASVRSGEPASIRV